MWSILTLIYDIFQVDASDYFTGKILEHILKGIK
jgi:hypothetical protein